MNKLSLESQVAMRTAELADLVEELNRRKALDNELLRSLEIARKAASEQQAFLAMASHEFRTPLAIIDTTLQQMAFNPDAGLEKTQARIRNAQGAVSRMLVLMDKYLTLDRLNNHPEMLNLRDCHLSLLLHKVSNEWPTGRVHLSVHDLPLNFFCDPDLLSIVLRNLLNNAARHSPLETPIELHATGLVNDCVQILVIDHGEGIDPADIDQIFNKYARGHSSQYQSGSGLGLFLVDQIVKIHNGSISVKSSKEMGSTFTLMLPIR